MRRCRSEWLGTPARRLLLPSCAMRIAMISTPFVPVPPPRYGGTELIVAELVTGLAAAGHEVTLFATGDSRPPRAHRCARASSAPHWPPDAVRRARSRRLRRRARSWPTARGFDVVHAHVPAALPFARMLDAPMVYTVHHDDGDEYARLQALYRRSRAHFVAISARQRELMPELADARVIHHGLDPGASSLRRAATAATARSSGASRAKRVRTCAIDAARAARPADPPRRARRIWRDHDYFEREIGARLCTAGRRCDRRSRRRATSATCSPARARCSSPSTGRSRSASS